MRKWLRVCWWTVLAGCAACLLPVYETGTWMVKRSRDWANAIADRIEREMQEGAD